MSSEQHRLAAILFADIAGYSLMPEKVALQFRRQMLAFVAELLPAHGGRLVKTQGDDILAEFVAATEALSFALALQDKIATRNNSAALSHRFRLRIGIHTGEVVVEGDDILGAAVNTAKRTESLAAPGGICLTEPVWHQVREELPHPARRLGKLPVKHVKALVFYHVDPPGGRLTSRLGHRLRLAMERPGRVMALLVLVGLTVGSSLILLPLAERYFPSSPAQLLDRAEHLLERYDQANNVMRAMDDLARIPSTAPQFSDAQACRALAYWRRYYETGELKTRTEASSASSNAIVLNAEIPLAHFVQALVAKDQGNWLLASNQLSRANALEGEENGPVLIELAEICQLLHDPVNSSNYIHKAEHVQRKAWYFYHELGKYEFRRGNYDAALSNELQATRLAPRNAFVECNLASFYLSLSDYTNHFPDAWACLERSRKYRSTAFYHFTLGQYYLLQESWEKSFGSFRTAAELRPKDYRFWGLAGMALRQSGKLEQAADFLTTAIAKAQSILPDTEDCLVRAHVGLYQAALGHPAEALAALKMALVKCPGYHQVREAAVTAQPLLQGKDEAAALERLLDNP